MLQLPRLVYMFDSAVRVDAVGEATAIDSNECDDDDDDELELGTSATDEDGVDSSGVEADVTSLGSIHEEYAEDEKDETEGKEHADDEPDVAEVRTISLFARCP